LRKWSADRVAIERPANPRAIADDGHARHGAVRDEVGVDGDELELVADRGGGFASG
jgi:hypothetical protein